MSNLLFLCALFFSVLSLSGCAQSKYMTFEDYHDVSIGQSIADIQVQIGRPYEVKGLEEKQQEYIYIERFSLGEGRDFFREYILIVEDGKVVDKRVKEESSSPIQFVG